MEEGGHKKLELGKNLMVPAIIGLLLIVPALQCVRGQQQQQQQLQQVEQDPVGQTLAGARRVGGGLFDWQVERLINRALEDGLRKRGASDNSYADQRRRATSSAAAMQRLLETIPMPSQRSTNGWPLVAPTSSVSPGVGGRAERHSPQQQVSTPGKFQVGALDTLDQLSAILEGDSLSRLGRAFKPRTMSTARGFGKRSDMAPKLNGFD